MVVQERLMRCRYLVFACIVLTTTPTLATPLVFDGIKGVVKWKRGAVINVYIPLDPKRNDPDAPRERHKQLTDAVDQWKEVAKDADITINSVTLDANGNIPGTTDKPNLDNEGTVQVTWENNSSSEGGSATPNIAEAQQKDGTKTGQMNSSDVRIDEKNTANKTLDEAKAMATMLHEMGHVLGIDHSKEKDSCLHEQLDVEYKTKVGESDKREFKSTSLDWSANMQTAVAAIPEGYRYTLEVNWESGGEGALAQLVTGGAAISDVALPMGWELYEYPGPSKILTFRLDPTDDLQAYLSSSQPTEIFAFTSPVGPAVISGWAGTDQLVLGPSVPEPTTLFALAIGIGGMGIVSLRRRRL
jgi:hypothetical protein